MNLRDLAIAEYQRVEQTHAAQAAPNPLAESGFRVRLATLLMPLGAFTPDITILFDRGRYRGELDGITFTMERDAAGRDWLYLIERCPTCGRDHFRFPGNEVHGEESRPDLNWLGYCIANPIVNDCDHTGSAMPLVGPLAPKEPDPYEQGRMFSRVAEKYAAEMCVGDYDGAATAQVAALTDIAVNLQLLVNAGENIAALLDDIKGALHPQT